MARRAFRVQPGKGGLRGEAARVQRAASGANNPAIYDWMRNRRYNQGDEGGGDPNALDITDGGGDSGEGYTPEDPPITQPLNRGNAWSGPWIDKLNFIGIQALDNGEEDLGAGGFGFSNDWVTKANFIGPAALDDGESYADSASVQGLNGNTSWSNATGWSNAWET